MNREFSINTKEISATAFSLETLSNELQSLSKRLEQCGKSPIISSTGFEAINQTINALYKETLQEAINMNSFQEALKNIVQVYVNCETSIVNKQPSAPSPQQETSSEGADKRGFWEKVWDFIFGEDKGKNYTATTDEQQEAADKEMQKQIQALLSSTTYSEDAWKSATPEERQAILENYMHELEAITGIDVKNNVNFFYEKPKDGLITNGYYTNSDNQVSINSYIIDTYPPEDSYFLFTTITHEMRHAYQHAAVDNPTDYQVNKETLEQWEENFDNYISSSDNYQDYLNQPVEDDARTFAGQQ